MKEYEIYSLLLAMILLASPLTAFCLLYFSAPYGRYFSQSWGPHMNGKISWIFMESAAILSFDAAYFLGEWASNPVSLFFFFLWNLHYLDRTFLFPMRLPPSGKRMPVAVMGMGFFFNLINGYLNGRFLSLFGNGYTLDWLIDPRFIIGTLLFAAGFMINRYADSMLIKLRKPGESGYKIPKGLLFEYVSCPNYLGEVVEWFGWALATWSLPGLAFALFTASNLIPRAYAHHRWYQKQFASYPQHRRAIIPFVL